jgi:3-oxoacyl-[acyl-carrier-protein] synthase III
LRLRIPNKKNKNKSNNNTNKNKNKTTKSTPNPAKSAAKTVEMVARHTIGDTGFLALDVDSNDVNQAKLNTVNLTVGAVEFRIRSVTLRVARFGRAAVVLGQIGPIALGMQETADHTTTKMQGGDLVLTTGSTTGWALRKHTYCHAIASQHSVVETRVVYEVRVAVIPHI